jgi:hypothetical protein
MKLLATGARCEVAGDQRQLVVIDDLYIERASLSANKANSPLQVDPDAVLASSVPRERLQVVAGRRSQKVQRHSSIQIAELLLGLLFERSEITMLSSRKKRLRFLALERLN